MQMSPVIAVHLTAALAALVLGPIALWARRGHGQPGRSVTSRPRLHRAAGYAWVSMMLLALNGMAEAWDGGGFCMAVL